MVQSYDEFDEEVRVPCDNVMLVISLQLGGIVEDLQKAKKKFVKSKVKWKLWKLVVYYYTSYVV